MCGGLLAQILILPQTIFVHLVVKQICDRRQLPKVIFMGSFYKHQGPLPKTGSDQRWEINQSCFMGFFFGHCGPLPFPLPDLGMNIQIQKISFPDSGNDTYRISRTPLLPCQHGVSCEVQKSWQSYWTRLRTSELVSEACLPPPPCLGLLSILPNSMIVNLKFYTLIYCVDI